MNNRVIKFRVWDSISKEMHSWHVIKSLGLSGFELDHYTLMQYAGIRDRTAKDIYEGDILEFADKWEWYRGKYGIKMLFASKTEKKKLMEAYENEPMERRVISLPDDYEWLLSPEIQQYWQVIGNIYENPELLIKK